MIIPEAHLRDFKDGQFGMVRAQWFASVEVRSLPHAVRSVWVSLNVLLNSTTRTGFASYNEIFAHAGCVRKTAITAVRILKNAGLIVVKHQGSKHGNCFLANQYELLPPPSLAKSAVTVSAEDTIPLKPLEFIPTARPSVGASLLRGFYEAISGPLAGHYTPAAKDLKFIEWLIQQYDVKKVTWILEYALNQFGTWKPNSIFAAKRYIEPALACWSESQPISNVGAPSGATSDAPAKPAESPALYGEALDTLKRSLLIELAQVEDFLAALPDSFEGAPGEESRRVEQGLERDWRSACRSRLLEVGRMLVEGDCAWVQTELRDIRSNLMMQS